MSDEVGTALRYLQMLSSVPRSPQTITVRILHAQLCASGHEISIRTVQRDLVRLSAHFPLTESDAIGPVGAAWSWQRDADFIDIPGIDLSTAVALLLSQKHLEPLVPVAVLDRMNPFFKRSESLLKTMSGHALSKWRDKIRVLHQGPTLRTPSINPNVQDTIYESVLVGRQIEVSYRRRGEEYAKQALLNPLGLVVKDGITYLIATAWDYTDPYQYSLHRFVSAKLLETQTKSPPGFKLDHYIDTQKAFSYPESQNDLLLVLQVDKSVADLLRERPLSLDQTIEAIDSDDEGEGAKVSATVADTSDLRWWLRGFGDCVEVIKPITLRAEFRQVSKAMATRYARRGKTT